MLNVIYLRPKDTVEHILIDFTTIRILISANLSSTLGAVETKITSSLSETANGVVYKFVKSFSMSL